ncbi:MAG: PAS domain S-box protein [Planctomycetes bacterium]|nr:PAS domain S-box protein [Planctomycetota bacterium]
MTRAQLAQKVRALDARVLELERAEVERRQHEETLREKAATLRAVIDCSLNPVITIGFDGTVQLASYSVERVFGWKPEEVVGQNVRMLMPEPYHSQHNEALANYRRTGQTTILGRTREFEGLRKNGTVFPCEITVWRVDLPGKDAPLFTGVIVDISERKRAEVALRAGEERYRTLFEDSRDAIYIVTREYVHPAERDRFQQEIEQDGSVRDYEVKLRKKDETAMDCLLTSTLRRAEDGTILGYQGVIRDVTERQQARERLRRHEAELAHVLRLSTVGEMASGLAHELNQPLSAVSNHAEAWMRRLRSGAGTSEELLAALEQISQQAVRAGEIIRHLRDFVRKGEPRRSTVGVDEIVHEVVALVSSEAQQKQITLRLELAPGMPAVAADRIQIEQVLLNLVRNAFEAMTELEAGTRALTIRTSTAAEELVEVAVADTGRGLNPETIDHVFEPYFTTKAGGLGMGLSISRAIVEAHGGRLWATPNPDRGVTFRFTLAQ